MPGEPGQRAEPAAQVAEPLAGGQLFTKCHGPCGRVGEDDRGKAQHGHERQHTLTGHKAQTPSLNCGCWVVIPEYRQRCFASTVQHKIRIRVA